MAGNGTHAHGFRRARLAAALRVHPEFFEQDFLAIVELIGLHQRPDIGAAEAEADDDPLGLITFVN